MGKQKTLTTYAEWRLAESMREYDFYYTRLERLIKTLFVWEGLPDGISARFLEKALFDNGWCLFYKNKAGFFQVSKASKIGINEYEEPTGFRTVSINSALSPSQLVKADKGVVIANDIFWASPKKVVNFFAKKLSNIEKTITMNLEHLKRPYVITCPEGMESSVDLFMTEKTNGKDYITVKEKFMESVNFQIIPLSIKNQVPVLEQSKKIVMNEALTYFGINNVNILKRERLTASEGSENDEEILLSRCAMYKTRKEASKKISEMCGDRVDVKMSTEVYREIMDLLKGGVEDVEIFNDNTGND